MRRPVYLGIHPPRQTVHQCANGRDMTRRGQRIDAKSLVTLRESRRAEKVPKTGRCRITAHGSGSRSVAAPGGRCSSSLVRSHRKILTPFAWVRDLARCREIIVIGGRRVRCFRRNRFVMHAVHRLRAEETSRANFFTSLVAMNRCISSTRNDPPHQRSITRDLLL